jgi:hypothetical protein
MEEPAPKPPQFGLKWLFVLPALAGALIAVYSAGLASEVLFWLLACPILIALWVGFSRLVARLFSEL